MTTTTYTEYTRKRTETTRTMLLERLALFEQAAINTRNNASEFISSFEDTDEVSAAASLRDLSPFIHADDYQNLVDGWRQVRLSADTNATLALTRAVEQVRNRIANPQ